MRLQDLPDNLTIPEGFALTSSRGLFTNHNGPVFAATAPDDLRSGMFVLDRHCNGMGFLHGGMASAFADRALAVAVWDATKAPSVTLKLSLHFYDTVPLHSWIEAVPEVYSATNGVVQLGAEILIDGAVRVARADATFRTVSRTKK